MLRPSSATSASQVSGGERNGEQRDRRRHESAGDVRRPDLDHPCAERPCPERPDQHAGQRPGVARRQHLRGQRHGADDAALPRSADRLHRGRRPDRRRQLPCRRHDDAGAVSAHGRRRLRAGRRGHDRDARRLDHGRLRLDAGREPALARTSSSSVCSRLRCATSPSPTRASPGNRLLSEGIGPNAQSRLRSRRALNGPACAT